MAYRLEWNIDGNAWPHRLHSRFVQAAGIRWHVQIMGSGPVLLLLHGTGSSTHTWRSLAPLLATHYTLVAPDLPGHAFSDSLPPGQLSLPGMAEALRDLLKVLSLQPVVGVGHSAGAAILARMSLDGALTRDIVSINGALLPFARLPALLLTPLARVLALNPLTPRLFAWRARREQAVRQLIDSTGSKLDEQDVQLYVNLVRSPAHVAGALAMMAKWDLQPLIEELPRLRVPLSLIVGTRDKTVSPAEADRVARRVTQASVQRLEGLGHLAHEEAPEKVAQAVLRVVSRPLPGSMPV